MATAPSDTAARGPRDGAFSAPPRTTETPVGDGSAVAEGSAAAADTAPARRALQESLDLRDQGHVAES